MVNKKYISYKELKSRNECSILDKLPILFLSVSINVLSLFKEAEYTDIYTIESMALWWSYKYLSSRSGKGETICGN